MMGECLGGVKRRVIREEKKSKSEFNEITKRKKNGAKL
jgi:hypothetical protein